MRTTSPEVALAKPRLGLGREIACPTRSQRSSVARETGPSVTQGHSCGKPSTANSAHLQDSMTCHQDDGNTKEMKSLAYDKGKGAAKARSENFCFKKHIL
jgi:hypothetical protein